MFKTFFLYINQTAQTEIRMTTLYLEFGSLAQAPKLNARIMNVKVNSKYSPFLAHNSPPVLVLIQVCCHFPFIFEIFYSIEFCQTGWEG